MTRDIPGIATRAIDADIRTIGEASTDLARTIGAFLAATGRSLTGRH